MPNLTPVNSTVNVGHFDILRSNPVDASGFPATPTTNYTWTVDDATIVSITPQDAFFQNCKIVGLKPGVTSVHAANTPASGGEIENWAVTVLSGPYDHDVPSADPQV